MKFTNQDIKAYADSIDARIVITSMVTGKPIVFPAFLTDIAQTFSSTWNTETVFGRSDPIATFQGTQRSISIAFDLPAGDKTVAQHNLDLTAQLSAMVYPSYQDHKVTVPGAIWTAARIMKSPPLVKIKFANLISGKANGLLGYIDSLSINPVMESGMYSVNKKLYPKVISISFGFNVLHQDTMGWNDENKQWIPTKVPFLD